MPASRPALRALRGHASPTPASLLSATIALAAAEAAFDEASWQLLDAETPAEVTLARLLFDAAGDRLETALARRARAEAEANGKRWLVAVPRG